MNDQKQPGMNIRQVEGTDEDDNSQLDENELHLAHPLHLTWSFGLNRHIPVLNLSKDSEKAVFYITSNVGVIYDWRNNKQSLLQGHCNAITCSYVSLDKRWLVTGDAGKNSTVIIWDTAISVPIRILFDVYEDGVRYVALSHDSKFLATISYSTPQVLSIWDWTTENDVPLSTVNLSENYGLQTYIMFHPSDSQHFVSNSKNQVVFYSQTREKINVCAPALSDKDFNKAVGLYSQSMFQTESDCALTATSCGNIVVWVKKGSSRDCDRKASKIIKVQESSITVLVQHHSFIVTGDTTGSVKFFDETLKLQNWYSQMEGLGSINALSFACKPLKDPRKLKTHVKKAYPTSSTLHADPFIVTDFIVGTVKANTINFKTKGSHVQYIKQEHDNDVTAIACHPTEPRVCIGSHCGLLQLWDFEKKTLVSSRQFPAGDEITAVTFDSIGHVLAVGFSDGKIIIVDALVLKNDEKEQTTTTFHHCHGTITKLQFSHDSDYLASTDLDRCVAVFKADRDKKRNSWSYVGKQRAHYKTIADLCFAKVLDEDRPRLLTLGEDRVMVEYDLENSTVDNLIILASDRIEQSAVPLCFTWYPPVVKEDFIAFANNHYKLKLLNSTTKMCRKTVLGPTYGSPVRRMSVLPSLGDQDTRYMAYATTDKVGLIILPFDGNPHKSVAMVAHPGKVHNMACSYDGCFVFTAGGSDCSVLMWKVDIAALEATARLGGEDLIPFYGLLEGGRDGELFAELEDYFYYAQMRSQGIDCVASREVSTKIPISEIPFVMRALGHYPTEQEVDDMLNEVKFSNYVETGQYVTEIDLGDFIKLYVNHRPAFGLSPDDLQDAFKTLAVEGTSEEASVPRKHLLTLLQSKGEHLTETEMAEYLSVLLGMEDKEQVEESNTQSLAQYNNFLSEQLPEDVNANMFATELLGFQVEEP